MNFNESTVDDASLDRFEVLGYPVAHGPHLATLRETLLPKLLSGELKVNGVRAEGVADRMSA